MLSDYEFDPDLDEMDPDDLKDYNTDYYFRKYETQKIRQEPLDDKDNFNHILIERKDALLHHRFDILDIGLDEPDITISKVKFSDLISGSSRSSEELIQTLTDPNDDNNEGISILASLMAQNSVNDYQEHLEWTKDDSSNKNNSDDSDSGTDSFKWIDERCYPHLPLRDNCPLKCKWIDRENNIHFEYFKLYSADKIIDVVINTDKMNRPSCQNWCVKYEYKYDRNRDQFDIISKSFDYDLFWSCCLYFHLFKTCGIINYDKYFNKMLPACMRKKQQNDNKATQVLVKISYHNKKKEFIPEPRQIKTTKKKHVCNSTCRYMDEQAYMLDHGADLMRSQPVNLDDPFILEMMNRKKCLVLGKFEIIDRELLESMSQNKNEKYDVCNILTNIDVMNSQNDFKQNNEWLTYKLNNYGEFEFLKNDNSDFKLKNYAEDHRCIALWIDDDGKKHEEWFKLNGRCPIPFDQGIEISSVYWEVECDSFSQNTFSKSLDQNAFWTMATMFKVFGICGAKRIDQEYYELLKIYKYLVSGYVSQISKKYKLSSTVPLPIIHMITKYHPFMLEVLN